MCTTAFSAVDDNIFDGSMMQTQQAERAHLHKGQAESHEKLLHSFCIGGGGTAADGAGVTKLVITALSKQCVMQTDESCNYTARETEIITARDTEKIIARDTEVKQMAALNK